MKIAKNERSLSVNENKKSITCKNTFENEAKEKIINHEKASMAAKNNIHNNVINRLQNLKQQQKIYCYSEKNSDTKENSMDIIKEEKLMNRSKMSNEESIFEFFSRTENEIDNLRMKLKTNNIDSTNYEYNQSNNNNISNNNHIYTNSIIINNNNNNFNKNYPNMFNKNVEILDSNKVKRDTPSFLKPIELNKSDLSMKIKNNEDDNTCDNLIILSNNMKNECVSYTSKRIVNKIQNLYDTINNTKKEYNISQNSKLMNLLNKNPDNTINFYLRNDNDKSKLTIPENNKLIPLNSLDSNSSTKFRKKIEEESLHSKINKIHTKNNFEGFISKMPTKTTNKKY